MSNTLDITELESVEEELAVPYEAASVEAPERPSLRRAAVNGSMWTMAGFAAGNFLKLGSNLILSRLLVPDAFGLMALLGVFIAGLAMFSDVGIGPSIIQNPLGETPEFLRAAFTIQAIRGFFLWAGTCILAWPVAHIYHQPALLTLLPVMGLTGFISGFNSTAMFRWERHLGFKRLTMIELASQLCSIAVMTAWAIFSPTVWALLAGSIASAILKMALSHLWSEHDLDGFGWNAEARKSLFRYGRWIFLSTMLTFLSMQTDRLIFGKLVPIAMVGIYSIAANLGGMPTTAILRLFVVAFPTYSRVHEAGGDLRGVFHKVRLPMLLCGGCAVAAMIAGGDLIVRVLYDTRYLEAGWMLRLIAAAAWFQVLDCTNAAVLLAIGKSNWMAAGGAAKVAGMMSLALLGFHFFGFRGAIGGMALSDALKYLVSSVGSAKYGLNSWPVDSALSVFTIFSAIVALCASYGVAHLGGGKIPQLSAIFAAVFITWGSLTAWQYREYLSGLSVGTVLSRFKAV